MSVPRTFRATPVTGCNITGPSIRTAVAYRPAKRTTTSIACRTNPTPTTSEPTTASSTTTPTTTPNKPAQIANEYTVTAQVLGVAPDTRTLGLRCEDGTTLDVVADANVRRFGQIEVGDVSRVRYRESLMATRLPPGEPMRPAEASVGAGRAPVGAKPAGAAGPRSGREHPPP